MDWFVGRNLGREGRERERPTVGGREGEVVVC